MCIKCTKDKQLDLIYGLKVFATIDLIKICHQINFYKNLCKIIKFSTY